MLIALPNAGSLIQKYLSLGDNPSILQREITAIQELLDEQPDSKCAPSIYLYLFIFMIANCKITGCMESIVYYKKLLLQKHATTLGSSGQSDLRKGCLALLVTLQTIDPMRRQRYVELGR